MATNRQDTLDPALLRPGRLDRKIEFPLPDRRQKRLVFSTLCAKMNLSNDVDLEDFIARPDKISGAEICSICQEAGMIAVRENRYVVLSKGQFLIYRFTLKPNIFRLWEGVQKSTQKQGWNGTRVLPLKAIIHFNLNFLSNSPECPKYIYSSLFTKYTTLF